MVKNPGNKSGDAVNAAEDYSERRKYFRADLPLKARFLTKDGQERACIVSNISAGGAMVRTKHPPTKGSKVVLYIDQLGRFEGTVIRSGDNVFAITYAKRRAKAAKVADDLTQVMNRGQRVTDRRNSPRIQQDAPAIIHLEDGRSAQCAILDISLTGASIEISPRPPLGAQLVLGRMTAKVVRRHEKGIGVVFTGAAERMDDVIADASRVEPEPETGPNVAPPFGKKSADV